MKTKIFGILLLLGLSAELYAQARTSRTSSATTRTGARTTLRDGSSILRIEVGTDDRDQAIRIRNLEQAVRDLQYRIYDLELNDTMNRTRAVDMYICTLTPPGINNGVYIGRASTQVEARAQAINNCNRARAFFCDAMNAKMLCERTVEYVNY